MDGRCSTTGKVGGGGQIATDVHLKEFLANRGASRGITSSWGQYKIRFASCNPVKTCLGKKCQRHSLVGEKGKVRIPF